MVKQPVAETTAWHLHIVLLFSLDGKHILESIRASVTKAAPKHVQQMLAFPLVFLSQTHSHTHIHKLAAWTSVSVSLADKDRERLAFWKLH